MTPTKDLIEQAIRDLPTFTDEQLVHYYKCSLTRQGAPEKLLYYKLMKAIEAERRARNKSQTTIEEDSHASTDES